MNPPTNERKMLIKVALTENLISTSLAVGFVILRHNVVFDLKVKNEKSGKSKSAGRLR